MRFPMTATRETELSLTRELSFCDKATPASQCRHPSLRCWALVGEPSSPEASVSSTAESVALVPGQIESCPFPAEAGCTMTHRQRWQHEHEISLLLPAATSCSVHSQAQQRTDMRRLRRLRLILVRVVFRSGGSRAAAVAVVAAVAAAAVTGVAAGKVTGVARGFS